MDKLPELARRPRLAPLALSVAIAIGGCSGGDQLGTTNDGLAGGAPVSGSTLGVIGGVALVGVLLGLDDDDDAVINSDGTDGGADGGGVDGGGADGGGTDGGGADGGGTDGGGADGGGTDGGGVDGGGTDGGGVDGGGADGGGVDGGGTDGGGVDGGGTDGGGVDGGSTDGGGGTDGGGTDGGDGSAPLQADGGFATDLNTTEVIPAGDTTNPASGVASGVADLVFNRNTGDAFGFVQLSNFNADRVDIMLGPSGTNGFVAVDLEHVGGNRWEIPAVLSQQQRDILLQNINLGNLYVLASTDEQPNGVLRRQIISPEVTRAEGQVTAADGSSAIGIVNLNRNTRDYAITYNTEGAGTLTRAHLLEGDLSGGETVIRDLSQRPSNPARFFDYGTFSAAEVQALDNGLYSLDAHDIDDNSLLLVPLN